MGHNGRFHCRVPKGLMSENARPHSNSISLVQRPPWAETGRESNLCECPFRKSPDSLKYIPLPPTPIHHPEKITYPHPHDPVVYFRCARSTGPWRTVRRGGASRASRARLGGAGNACVLAGPVEVILGVPQGPGGSGGSGSVPEGALRWLATAIVPVRRADPSLS